MPVPPVLVPWGRLPDGRTAHLITLENGGLRARFSDYGALLVSLEVPDRSGQRGDVVLGFDTLDEYLRPGHSPYFGCVVGRVGNRIAGGRCRVAGLDLVLATNNHPGGRPCHLHGGDVGFDKVLWSARTAWEPTGPVLELRHRSPAGDQGYPGTLDTVVRYRLLANGVLQVTYEAVTDAPTIVNLTQHTYFNLAGQGTVLDHDLQVDADQFVPVDAGLIPLGRLAPVAGTPLDFRQTQRVGARIDADDPQIAVAAGYDHTWVIRGAPGTLRPAAVLRDPSTGRVMSTWTTEPGVQIYTGNFLPTADQPALVGKGGAAYRHRGGICLETQHFPDTPNQPTFPPIDLRPGEVYRSQTEFRFTVS